MAIVAHVAHVVADRGAHGVVLQGGCVCLQESLERFLFSLVLLTQFVNEIPEEALDFEIFKSFHSPQVSDKDAFEDLGIQVA